MAAEIVTTQSEHRHIAKRMDFDAGLAPYINWESIAQYAREVGGHFEARYAQDGACQITVWWPLTVEDYAALKATEKASPSRHDHSHGRVANP